MGTDGGSGTTTQLPFGTETLQTPQMQELGIGINIEHKVVICSICNKAILPNMLFVHLREPNGILQKSGVGRHHVSGSFKPGRKLAFFTKAFCAKFIEDHKLEDPINPQTIIQAIPGLTVRLKMLCCSHCGYAAVTHRSLSGHKKVCPQSVVEECQAQTFNSSITKLCFGVRLPHQSNPSPLVAAILFRQQFSTDLHAAVPVQATLHPREMNIFLRYENWLNEVDGMTGSQITELARRAQPDLRERVKETILRYALVVVTKLQGIDDSVSLALGDYNE
jgi:hypothetical protein